MVNKVLANLLEGLFPNYCALCNLRTDSPLPLCPSCRDDLQANSSCCLRCALPLAPLAAAPARLCGKCLRTPPPYDRVLAPWVYCERLAYLIHLWKYQGQTRLTPLLARLWIRQLTATPAVDMIVPVPLHWRRLWSRGFNQAEILGRELQRASAELVCVPLDSRSARRALATPTQSSLGARDRAHNLRGAFTVSRRYDNLNVAIVDDVLTTGATAAALAGVLRAAGARHIQVWCLARTPAPGGGAR